MYLYRAIDKFGKTFEFMRSKRWPDCSSGVATETNGLSAGHTTLEGIEVTHMILKQQFQSNHRPPFEQSASLQFGCINLRDKGWPSIRAILRKLKLFLFDEPFSNLDAKMQRVQ